MPGFPKVNQTVSGGYYMANLDSIAEFLEDNGYSRAAAAGVAGTIAGESGGNPEVNSGGLIQNTPAIPGLVTGNAQQDFDNQLTNLLQYANANSAEAVARGGVNLATFKQASNPTQAAEWWGEFEGPLVPGSDVRANVANSVYNAVGTYTPGTQYTQPANSGLSATGGNSGGGTTAILDSLPGGAFDPLNWPSYAGRAVGGAAGAAAAGIGTGIESAVTGLFGNIMKSLGFTSGKDFLIRISLILMGAIILIIGIKSLANSSGTLANSGAGNSGGGEGLDSDVVGGGNLAGIPDTDSSSDRPNPAHPRRSAASNSSPTKTAKKRTATKRKSFEKVISKDAVEGAVMA